MADIVLGLNANNGAMSVTPVNKKWLSPRLCDKSSLPAILDPDASSISFIWGFDMSLCILNDRHEHHQWLTRLGVLHSCRTQHRARGVLVCAVRLHGCSARYMMRTYAGSSWVYRTADGGGAHRQHKAEYEC